MEDGTRVVVASAQGQEENHVQPELALLLFEMTPSEHLAQRWQIRESAISAPVHGGGGSSEPC